MWKWLWNWVISRDYNNFKVHGRISLDDPEEVVGRNVGPEKSFNNSENIYICSYVQNVARDINVKGTSDENLEGDDEHVIGNWRKSGSCYKVIEHLA